MSRFELAQMNVARLSAPLDSPRRREWFEKMDLYLVLWWVPRGHRPTPPEAPDVEIGRAHATTG